MRKLSQTGLRWIWVSVIVLCVDRLTKYFAHDLLQLYKPVYITFFFNLTLAYNKGAAFSFLGNASGWQTWFFGSLSIVISFILLLWLKRLPYQKWWTAIALTLIVGGALGNLCDRIYYGQVIDFLQFHIKNFYWPVFNLADSAICVGAFMLIGESLIKKR